MPRPCKIKGRCDSPKRPTTTQKSKRHHLGTTKPPQTVTLQAVILSKSPAAKFRYVFLCDCTVGGCKLFCCYFLGSRTLSLVSPAFLHTCDMRVLPYDTRTIAILEDFCFEVAIFLESHGKSCTSQRVEYDSGLARPVLRNANLGVLRETVSLNSFCQKKYHSNLAVQPPGIWRPLMLRFGCILKKAQPLHHAIQNCNMIIFFGVAAVQYKIAPTFKVFVSQLLYWECT